MNRWLCLALVCAGLVVGCNSKPSTVQNVDDSHLRPLAMLWSQFTGQHQGKPPASKEEFQAFVKGLKPEVLSSMKIGDVEKQFISERDNKPYVILYGQQAPAAGPGPSGGVMGYEQEGKDGKRIVAMSMGQVRLVDEAEFQKLVPGKSP